VFWSVSDPDVVEVYICERVDPEACRRTAKSPERGGSGVPCRQETGDLPVDLERPAPSAIANTAAQADTNAAAPSAAFIALIDLLAATERIRICLHTRSFRKRQNESQG
jgi:hypothetical protein